MIERHDIIEALRRACEREPAILAAYLGGSDATGRTDAMSDVDLVVIAEDGKGEWAMAFVRAAVEGLGPLAFEYRVPEPAWHGMAQLFLRPAGAPDWLFVDAVATERSRLPTLTDRERHGEPLVWFDPEGLIRVTEHDAGAHAQRVRAAVEQARGMLGLGGQLVRKAAARGFPAEASSMYHRMVLGQVVTLARAVHCPGRHDFGARYLDRDVPSEVRARIERLAMPAGVEGLLDATAACEAWAQELCGARGNEPGA